MSAVRKVRPQLVEAPLTPADVFREYNAYVATLAYRLLGRNHDVDDLVQDVFLATVEGLDRLRAPGALKGWLATLTVRLARRKLQRRRLIAFFGFDDLPEPIEVASSEVSAEDRVTLNQVYEALNSAAVDDRLAWVLKNVEHEPLDVVASLCKCSLATAKRRIARAQEHIERRFSDEP